MNCPSCGVEIPEESKYCDNCGTRIAAPSQNTVEVVESDGALPKKKTGLIIARIVSFLIILGMLVWLAGLGFCYRSPIPKFNYIFAKYISDYHNLYIGMPYEKAIKTLEEKNIQIDRVAEGANSISVFTSDSVEIAWCQSDSQQLVFDDGQLSYVFIYFPVDKKTEYSEETKIMRFTEHYSSIFGVEDSSWLFQTKNLDISVSTFRDNEVAIVFDNTVDYTQYLKK